MTFAPVLPPLVLLVIAVVIIALRLLTMRRLHSTAGARWTTVWRWAGLTLAVLLILIAAARPGIEHGERGSAVAKQSAENTNVFFLVDRSADSAVDDYGDRQTRMSGIRNDIEALIDQYPGARFALVAFASRSSLDWPLSEDAWSLRPEVARLSPYPANDRTEDVNAAAAANVLRYQLIAAGQQYPDSKSLVFYFGSGAAGSRAPQGEFEPTEGAVDGGAVFGYGAGRNEPGLRRIAEQLGVPYVDRGDGRSISESVPDTGAPQPGAAATTSSGVADRTDLYWVFTLTAAVLLLFELFAGIRDLRRTRLARRDVTP
ncbi:vWA domain-containing protein [Mycolicibacterium stellerae]|uniref:VWA domain-containing protein n=1 Tax=Mycolicibacterium stellerae TaxID=2358193 RepID=UPI000F0B31BE|nr:VWA domain-containing protein [Mycolicibacterium stellerae]